MNREELEYNTKNVSLEVAKQIAFENNDVKGRIFVEDIIKDAKVITKYLKGE